MDLQLENYKRAFRLVSLPKGLALLFAFLAFAGTAQAALRATGLKMSGNAERTTIVMRFDSEVEPHWFQLESPYRLVIDLPETAFAFEKNELKTAGLVASIRYGHAGEGRSRLILSANRAFDVKRLDLTQAGSMFELAIEIKQTSDAAFHDALAEQVTTTGAVAKTEPEPKAADNRFKVVIDAGHGGFDGGAEGVGGTIEKEVTLAFAQELERRLTETGRYDVFMTRSDDRFLRLDERVKFARDKTADLFISIHADTIRFKDLRGATVYTVSDRASDAESEALADRENLSDQHAGAPSQGEDPQVSDILFDFVRRETQGFSTRIAANLVSQLSESVGVINNPHRHARFRVLLAPDVPSVLVELGYLSNDEDEKSLGDPQWRAKAAASIAIAVDEFAAARKGGLAAEAASE